MNWFERIKALYTFGHLKLKKCNTFSVLPTKKKVFYPGCALVAADYKFALKVYQSLKNQDPELGIWFDCCGIPMFMATDSLKDSFQERNLEIIKNNNVTEVVVACGYCHLLLDKLKKENNLKLKVTSIHEVLAKKTWKVNTHDEFIIHEPCSAEINPEFKGSFYSLVKQTDLKTGPLEDEAKLMKCCIHRSSFSPMIIRKLKDKKIITFCGYCAEKFSNKFKIWHILQILFKNEKQFKKRSTIAKFYSYWKFSNISEKL